MMLFKVALFLGFLYVPLSASRDVARVCDNGLYQAGVGDEYRDKQEVINDEDRDSWPDLRMDARGRWM